MNEIVETRPVDVTIGISVVHASLRALGALRREIAQVAKERDEVLKADEDYYRGQFEQLQAREEFHKANIRNYLAATNQNKVKTPTGTGFLQTRTVKTYPSKSTLLPWAIERGLVRTKNEVDMAKVEEHIKTTGEIPEGYTEEPVTELQIRRLAEKDDVDVASNDAEAGEP